MLVLARSRTFLGLRRHAQLLLFHSKNHSAAGALHNPWNNIHNNNNNSSINNTIRRCFYFTNGDNLKKDDPYAILGLDWADMPTTSDIKKAYRNLAAQYHPDAVRHSNNRSQQQQHQQQQRAQQKFAQIQNAYDILVKHSQQALEERSDEWQARVYRSADRIAADRKDVAGMARQRPLPSPKISMQLQYTLGHPQQRGSNTTSRGEYLDSRCDSSISSIPKRASSVGRGGSKWVTPKPFVPWKEKNAQKEKE